MTQIVFIGGTGRCGTNIMKDILSLHPNVASHSFEYRFIIDPDGIIDFYTTALNCWSPYIIDKKLRRLESFLMVLAKRYDGKEIYIDWELNKHFSGYEESVRDLMDELVDFKYNGEHYGIREKRDLYFMRYRKKNELRCILGSFIRRIINGYLKTEGKQIYVEDNTFNLLFSQDLLDLLPEAKFIHMIREPKDVIASLSKQRWAPKDKIQATYWMKDILDKVNFLKKTIPGKSLITIDLYDLVDETENELRRICDFLKIPFHRRLLEIDLSRSNRDRWRKELSYDELDQINKILDI